MLPPCSEGDLTVKFLLCGALLALSVWSHAEGAKVLGFTMDAPAPDGASLVVEAGEYAALRMKHRLCTELMAASDDLDVFIVGCTSAAGVDWSALLRGKLWSTDLRARRGCGLGCRRIRVCYEGWEDVLLVGTKIRTGAWHRL